jgi:hypothetical protein
MPSVQKGLIAAGVGMAVNIVLAIVKFVTGVLGNFMPQRAILRKRESARLLFAVSIMRYTMFEKIGIKD